jgi:3-phenylpropionate/cinnamic acid dioxygenase small subunit
MAANQGSAVKANAGMELRHEVEQLLFLERHLLEERRFDEWLGLMTEDVSYCVPNGTGDAAVGAIARDNLRGLQAHARRLAHPGNPTQVPVPRAKYLVTNVMPDAEENGEIPVRFALVVYLMPAEGDLVHHPASCDYRLRRTASGLKICHRWIRLLASDRPLGQLPLL